MSIEVCQIWDFQGNCANYCLLCCDGV